MLSKWIGVDWTHGTGPMEKHLQGEVVEVVSETLQGDRAKSAPVCEYHQDKMGDRNWHTYLSCGRCELEDSVMEAVPRKQARRPRQN